MNIKSTIAYIVTAIGYGIVFAAFLLLFFPNLRNASTPFWSSFTPIVVQEQALSYANAVQRASPAVAIIYPERIQNDISYGRNQRVIIGSGSGVIMDPNGYILTNYHVVQNADMISVVLQTGEAYAAQIIGYDIYTDLAVLKVDAINLPTIPQSENLVSRVGDVVLAIGNPLNLGQTVTQGIVSATGRNGLSSTSYQEFLQMDAAINDGNSGGALINTKGELVGINSRKFTESNSHINIQGIFFAIPYELAFKVMKQIIENGRVVRGWLGITSDEYRLDIKGFVIKGLAKDGPAERSGLQLNDIVYQIGDKPINSINQALDIVAETKPGTALNFKIYRDSVPREIQITIGELKNIR